jgi:hypothetical protein
MAKAKTAAGRERQIQRSCCEAANTAAAGSFARNRFYAAVKEMRQRDISCTGWRWLPGAAGYARNGGSDVRPCWGKSYAYVEFQSRSNIDCILPSNSASTQTYIHTPTPTDTSLSRQTSEPLRRRHTFRNDADASRVDKVIADPIRSADEHGALGNHVLGVIHPRVRHIRLNNCLSAHRSVVSAVRLQRNESYSARQRV